MAEIVIRTPQASDVDELVTNLRQADVDELRAWGTTDIRGCVASALERSVVARTGTADGRVGCVFGVTPLTLLGDVGVPWMLGTDLVVKHQRVLMRRCRPYIQDMLFLYPHLINFVHAGNSAAFRRLKCVGFSLQPAVPMAPFGELFHRFDLEV